MRNASERSGQPKPVFGAADFDGLGRQRAPEMVQFIGAGIQSVGGFILLLCNFLLLVGVCVLLFRVCVLLFRVRVLLVGIRMLLVGVFVLLIGVRMLAGGILVLRIGRVVLCFCGAESVACLAQQAQGRFSLEGFCQCFTWLPVELIPALHRSRALRREFVFGRCHVALIRLRKREG